MTASLNALTLKINASTDGVSKAVKAVRSDVNRINGVLRTTVTATDKAKQAQASLDRVYKTGAITRKEYIRAQDAIKQQLKASTAGASKASGVFTKFNIALAATAASAAVAARALGESFGAIDRLAKSADKLGIATEKLASYRLAAEETAGMMDNQFDTALQRMVRRTAEAAQGTGEAQKAIQELGLDAAKLGQMRPDEMFAAYAEAFKGVGNQSDRLRLAFKLFDSEGAALVNTLKIGKDGLASYEQAAESLGLTVNRFDASRIEAFNDAFGRIGKSVEGLKNSIVIALAPALERLAKTLTAVVGYIRGLALNISASQRNIITFAAAFSATVFILPKLVAGIKLVVGALRLLRNAQIAVLAFSGPAGWATLAAGAVIAAGAVYAVDSAFSSYNDTLAETKGNAEDAANAITNASNATSGPQGQTRSQEVASLTEQYRKRNKELRWGKEVAEIHNAQQQGATVEQIQSLKELQRENAKLNRAVEERTKKIKEEKKAIDDRRAALKSERKRLEDAAKQTIDKFKTPFDNLVDELAKLQRLKNEGFINQNTFGKAQDSALKNFRGDTIKVTAELPPSITKGSREEYRVIAEAQNKVASQTTVNHKQAMAERVAMRIATQRAADASEKSAQEAERLRDEVANLQIGGAV
jgi:hypothetical protein